MSRNILRLLMLGALMLAALASASSASATNWQSNGTSAGVPYSAVATSGARLQVAAPTTGNLDCTSATLSGKVFGPIGPPSTSPWNGVETISPGFAGCTINGIPVSLVSVSGGQINATSFTAPVTSDQVVNITIIFQLAGGCQIKITISLSGTTYNNGLSIFRILSSGQIANATWPTCADAIFGTVGGGSGPVRWGTIAPTPADINYQVTSSPAPVVFY